MLFYGILPLTIEGHDDCVLPDRQRSSYCRIRPRPVPDHACDPADAALSSSSKAERNIRCNTTVSQYAENLNVDEIYMPLEFVNGTHCKATQNPS